MRESFFMCVGVCTCACVYWGVVVAGRLGHVFSHCFATSLHLSWTKEQTREKEGAKRSQLPISTKTLSRRQPSFPLVALFWFPPCIFADEFLGSLRIRWGAYTLQHDGRGRHVSVRQPSRTFGKVMNAYTYVHIHTLTATCLHSRSHVQSHALSPRIACCALLALCRCRDKASAAC